MINDEAHLAPRMSGIVIPNRVDVFTYPHNALEKITRMIDLHADGGSSPFSSHFHSTSGGGLYLSATHLSAPAEIGPDGGIPSWLKKIDSVVAGIGKVALPIVAKVLIKKVLPAVLLANRPVVSTLEAHFSLHDPGKSPQERPLTEYRYYFDVTPAIARATFPPPPADGPGKIDVSSATIGGVGDFFHDMGGVILGVLNSAVPALAAAGSPDGPDGPVNWEAFFKAAAGGLGHSLVHYLDSSPPPSSTLRAVPGA